MNKPQKLISIVVPVYNEAGNLPTLYQDVSDALSKLAYQFEVIFVDDGSQDSSVEVIANLQARHAEIKLVQLSRNFGKEAALAAGLEVARGDAAIMLDADNQHPPDKITEFVAKWEAGADVVIGVRARNRGEGWIKRTGSRWFYRILTRITQVPVVPNSTDYRLIDRQVIDAFNQLTEHNRITRAMIDWLGFRSETVSFEAQARISGRAGYSYTKLIQLAMDSFVSLSLVPLRAAGYLGLIITSCSGLLGLFILVEKFGLSDPMHLGFSGTGMLAVMIVFLVGIILMSLGLIALYIAHIDAEVSGRPLYVVRRQR